jgi:hypothetical protein
MLHMKIDIVPFGQEEGRRKIYELFIVNTGAIAAQPGWANYEIYLTDPRFMKTPRIADAYTRHLRSNGAEHLVQQSIAALKFVKKIGESKDDSPELSTGVDVPSANNKE